VIPRFLCYRLSQLLGIYLGDIMPFRFLIDELTPRHGFLFGDRNGPWSTDRVTRAMIRETSIRLGFRMTVQEFRHIMIAIDRQFIRGTDAEPDDDEDDEDNVHDLMAAHSTRLAVARYARMGGLTRSLTTESINIFRGISDKWQRWYHLVSRKDQQILKTEAPFDPLQMEKYIEDVLVRMYGKGGNWLSQFQREAVMKVAKGINGLVVVLPTGSGKSLTFMLPAMLSNAKTTVLITPLRALADNMLARCHDADIDSYIYHGQRQPRMARIIIVVSDTAVTTGFMDFVAEVQQKGRLDRIVFDECHKIIQDKNFRPKLLQLRHLVLSTQFLFLTATLPPTMVEEFMEAMVISDPVFIRAINQKPQVRYKVQRIANRNFDMDVSRRIQLLVGEFKGQEKALVFCRTKKQTERWAQYFKCGFFHSETNDKRTVLLKWTFGLMFATGSLGAGVDVDGIKVVIHLGIPYGMVDFDQEVGRGGRKGEVVESIIFVSDEQYEELVGMDEHAMQLDERVIREFIVGAGCRRLAMGKYLNGNQYEINCIGLGEQLCDKCDIDLEGTQLMRKRRLESQEEERQVRQRQSYQQRAIDYKEMEISIARRFEHVLATVQDLQDICCICLLLKKERTKDHGGKYCREWETSLNTTFGEFRARYINRIKDTCCYTCSLPGDSCDNYRERRKCTKVDVIIPTCVMGFLRRRELRLENMIERISGRKYERVEDFCGWLCEKGRYLDVNGTNAFGMFECIVSQDRS
jgi:superfamily II DNA helicase RecQ